MSLSEVSLLDPIVLIICGILLYKNARLTSVHPGCMVLIFHAMFVTGRLYSVMGGSPTLFSHWPGTLPVSEQEIARAGFLADIALISITIGLIVSSPRDTGGTAPHSTVLPASPTALLSERVVRMVSAVALPIGILAVLVNGVVPSAENLSVDFGVWGTSSWLMVTQFWPVLGLLALIYFYGFRRSLMISVSILLVLMSIQGFNRFRVVLPVIFLLITWLTRTGRKWPRTWMVVSLACFAILVFPMKKLGWMVQSGESMSDLEYVVADSFSEVINGSAQDQLFLDQFASTLWLVDESGQYSYGRMYSSFLFLPIPRQLWPDKPALSWYWAEISTPSRPMYQNGMAPTMVGDAYLNFGLIGVIAVPFVFGYWTGKFYFAAMRKSYFSVHRFMYVIVACCLFQVLRDGLGSVIIFPAVNMIPLTAIAALSYIAWRRKQKQIVLSVPSMINRQKGAARA
jgi:oligosaccharide repeat unit polymerase